MSHHKKPHKPSVPTSKIYVKRGDWSVTPEKVDTCILRHRFNSQIQVVIPGFSALPDDLRALIARESGFVRLENLRLAALLDPAFAQEYLRSGDLVALSLPTPSGNTFAVDQGKLYLRLCEETYQSCGLTGRATRFPDAGMFYLVVIELRDPAMRAGKKGYDRVRRCLADLDQGTQWQAVMSWRREGEGMLVDGGAALPTPEGASAFNVQPDLDLISLPSALTPPYPFQADPEVASTQEHTSDLYEWLGMAAIGSARLCESDSSGPLIAGYLPPPGSSPQPLVSVNVTGFIHPEGVRHIVARLATACPWYAVSAHTAPGAPFSFWQAPTAKPTKKRGRGVMRGAERAADAGGSGWTLAAENRGKWPGQDVEHRDKKARLERPGNGGLDDPAAVKASYILWQHIGHGDTYNA